MSIAFSEKSEGGEIYRNIVKDSDNAITTDNFTLVSSFADNDLAKEVETSVTSYTDGKVIVRECAALNLTKSASPILITSEAASVYANGELTDKSGSYCIGAVAPSSDEGGKILVVPSVFLTASDALTTSGYANRDFIYSVLENVYGAQSVPYGCSPVYVNSSTLENLTMKSARIYTALILTVPVLVSAVGVVVTVKRKNR